MSPTINDKDIDDIVTRYETLTAKRETLSQNKVKLEAELSARRRALKKVMDEATEAGYDPNKIQEELQRAKEVLDLKLDNFKTELEEGESMVRPMLKELREPGA
jgi:chromosome segregation ATPase